MISGFILARFSPLWATVVLALVLEVLVGISIRDNLTLNLLNFIYPIEFITTWQNGG